MKRLALLLLLISGTAMSQQWGSSVACIWSGSLAECLPSSGLILKNQRQLRLGEGSNGAEYAAFQAPASLTANTVYTLPSDDGTNLEFLQTDGSGVLDWVPVDLSTAAVTGVLPLANGGTNGTDAAVNGGIVYSDADSMEISAAGTSNQVLQSNGAAAPTWVSIVNANIDAAAAIAGSKIVAATDAVAGAVTTAAQSFAGLKTFFDGIELDDDSNQDTLNYYREEDHATTFTMNGASGGTSGSVTLKVTRIGRLVTIGVPAVTASTGTSSQLFSSNTDLPAWATPAVERVIPFYIVNNTSTQEVGIFIIRTTGDMAMARADTVVFTNSTTGGASEAGAVTYPID